MPYKIVKRVKRTVDPKLVRGDYSRNFGVDLDDQKTWQLYPLSHPKPRIRGKVTRVLDIDGNKLYGVNEEYEFEVHCSQVYGGNNEIIETRFLYIPADFVRGYGIDEAKFVELLLQEVIVEIYGKTVRSLLYPKIVFIGSVDIQPKDEEGKVTGASESASRLEKEGNFDFEGRIAKIQSLMVLVSTGKAGMVERSQEYKKLYNELDKGFSEAGLKNPNPFSSLEEFYGFYRMRLPSYEERRNYIATLYKKEEKLISKIDMPAKNEKRFDKKYDVFICHASEDKEPFVKELAEALSKNLSVWYDEFSLSLGDSLRRKIDQGISDSRYGVVVLSENFFKKDWPQKELDGLVAKEHDFDKVILPIWHGVTNERVMALSPTLAGRLAVSSDKGIDHVVKEILKVVKQ
jgi:hypothetical protein